jgi:hypothetical protein
LDNAVLVLSTYSSSFAAIFSNNVVSGSRVISSGDGVYSTSVEQLTGEIWLGSLVYKRTVNTGVLPNNTSKPVVHSISNLEWVIKLEGIARNINGSFITADRPGDSAGAGHWRISADTTNIYLAATSDMTAYTESYVTLYYTKTA